MLNIDPNYRSLPEQVDFLTEKQEETDTIVNENTEDIELIKQDNIQTKDRVTTLEQKRLIDRALIDANTQNISNLNSEVEAISGRGGYLIPHNFETATPTENQLNAYALSQIPNITQPEEIFNGTRVTNLYNNHTWILNNTQDTDPVVFEWVDLGQSLVSIATNSTEGVVKGSADNLKVAVAVDGTMSVNGLQTELDSKQDELNTTNIPSGTIDESIGFDTDGNVVRGSAGGGQLYLHNITMRTSIDSQLDIFLEIITDKPDAYTSSTIQTQYFSKFNYTYIPCSSVRTAGTYYSNKKIVTALQVATSITGYCYYSSSLSIDFDNKTFEDYLISVNQQTSVTISSLTDKVTPL